MNKALMVQYGCTPGEVGGDGDDLLATFGVCHHQILEQTSSRMIYGVRRSGKLSAWSVKSATKSVKSVKLLRMQRRRRSVRQPWQPKHEPPLETPPVTMFVQVIKARNLLAMDKGGGYDPYATVELVNVDTGKAYKGASGDKKPFKTKTKTIKKTLHPNWEESGEDEVLGRYHEG